jgi:hypothetical protein
MGLHDCSWTLNRIAPDLWDFNNGLVPLLFRNLAINKALLEGYQVMLRYLLSTCS